MKRIPLLPTLALPLVLAVLATVAIMPSHAAASTTKSVTVDYVIALLDTGVSQADIVARIKEKNLTFRLSPGDLDRLRAAGAGKDLIETITGGAAVLENQESASPGGPTPRQERGGADTNGWGRPSRLGGKTGANTEGEVPQSGEGAALAAPSATYEGVDENGEGIEEVPDDGGYADSYYSSPGYYGYSYYYGYPYPYYYYPSFYYPYGFYGYYSSPFFHHPHHFSRPMPRGGGSFHGAPRGGGGGRPAPHGGGGGRPTPRGSHHH